MKELMIFQNWRICLLGAAFAIALLLGVSEAPTLQAFILTKVVAAVLFFGGVAAFRVWRRGGKLGELDDLSE